MPLTITMLISNYRYTVTLPCLGDPGQGFFMSGGSRNTPAKISRISGISFSRPASGGMRPVGYKRADGPNLLTMRLQMRRTKKRESRPVS